MELNAVEPTGMILLLQSKLQKRWCSNDDDNIIIQEPILFARLNY